MRKRVKLLLCLKYLGGKNLLSPWLHTHTKSCIISCVTLLFWFHSLKTHLMFLGQKIKSVSNFAISDYQLIPKYVIPTFHPNTESWAKLPAMRKSRRSFVFFVCENSIDSDLWRSYGTFRGFGVICEFCAVKYACI